MIVVSVFRDGQSGLAAISSNGHASEPICAAVSAVMQTVLLGVASATDTRDASEIREGGGEGEGSLTVHWPLRARYSYEVSTIVGAAVRYLHELSKAHPSDVTVEYVEVPSNGAPAPTP